MTKPVYAELSSLMLARANCIRSNNTEWLAKHTERLEDIVAKTMPSGSGFDNGTTLDIQRSTPEQLVFDTSFHHMDGNGSYAGWTEHRVTVRASLAFGFTLTISGRNRNAIKELISDEFDIALRQPAPTPWKVIARGRAEYFTTREDAIAHTHTFTDIATTVTYEVNEEAKEVHVHIQVHDA